MIHKLMPAPGTMNIGIAIDLPSDAGQELTGEVFNVCLVMREFLQKCEGQGYSVVLSHVGTVVQIRKPGDL